MQDPASLRAQERAVASVAGLAEVARAVVPTLEVTDTQAASLRSWYPEWEGLVARGERLSTGAVFTHDGRLFRTSQAVTATGEHTPGDAGLEALWYEIEVDPDGVIVWRRPTGAHDAPGIGDRRHHPGADGPVWVSKIAGNTTEPGSDGRWWSKE